MKKLIAFTLALVMCLSLCACGGGSSGTVYKLGDTVSTDIFEFTLDEAALAYALGNTTGKDYFLPKEYDAQKDNDNPLVAAKGHTLVAFTYTVKNTDRAHQYVSGSFATVSYGKKEYKDLELEPGYEYPYQDELFADLNGKPYTRKANKWYTTSSKGFGLEAGAKTMRRAYFDIPVDVESLTDTFEMTIFLPNSSDKTEKFTYSISG